jgi:hypothetical protein
MLENMNILFLVYVILFLSDSINYNPWQAFPTIILTGIGKEKRETIFIIIVIVDELCAFWHD